MIKSSGLTNNLDSSHLLHNGRQVEALHFFVQGGEGALDKLPIMLEHVIEEDCWQKFLFPKTGEIRDYTEKANKTFVDFARIELSVSIETLKKLCKDRNYLLNLIDKVTQRGSGGDNNPLGLGGWGQKAIDDMGQDHLDTVDNVHVDNRPTGNTQQAGLRRIRSELKKAKGTDTFETIVAIQADVLTDKMSVNKAMIKLGIRTPTFTIPIDPDKAAKAIKKRFQGDELRRLIELLND